MPCPLFDIFVPSVMMNHSNPQRQQPKDLRLIVDEVVLTFTEYLTTDHTQSTKLGGFVDDILMPIFILYDAVWLTKDESSNKLKASCRGRVLNITFLTIVADVMEVLSMFGHFPSAAVPYGSTSPPDNESNSNHVGSYGRLPSFNFAPKLMRLFHYQLFEDNTTIVRVSDVLCAVSALVQDGTIQLSYYDELLGTINQKQKKKGPTRHWVEMKVDGLGYDAFRITFPQFDDCLLPEFVAMLLTRCYGSQTNTVGVVPATQINLFKDIDKSAMEYISTHRLQKRP